MISLTELNNHLADYPAYRKDQAYKAIFEDLYENWDQASNIPKEIKTILNEKSPLEIKGKIFESKNGKTSTITTGRTHH